MDIGMDGKSGDYVGGTNFGEEGLAVNFTPRRERFTFRKKHLEVLEMCFKTNQYPTYEERTDIAQRCNDIMEVVCKCFSQLFSTDARFSQLFSSYVCFSQLFWKTKVQK